GVPRSCHRLHLGGFEILGVWLPNFIPGRELNIAGNFCTFNPVVADGSPAWTGWQEINKMQVMSVYENRKLFGAFAMGMLFCAAGCSLIPAANAQTSSTAAKIEVKLSEYKIDMPKTVPAGSTTFEVTNIGQELHNFEIEGNGIEKRVGELIPGETK